VIASSSWRGSSNLISAFLALLAIAFYVVVYTLILKRTNAPEHRHRRGAEPCRR